ARTPHPTQERTEASDERVMHTLGTASGAGGFFCPVTFGSSRPPPRFVASPRRTVRLGVKSFAFRNETTCSFVGSFCQSLQREPSVSASSRGSRIAKVRRCGFTHS